MALFKLQERPTDNIEAIMRKTKEQKDIKPTIKLKGTSLLAKLNAIKQKVKETLGEHINDYQLITTDEEWIEYCKKAKEDEYIAIDTETDSLDSILAHLVGVCIYSPSQKPAYVPVGHISVITEQKIEPQVSLDAIKEGLNIIKDSKLIFHNAYYDLVVIYQNTGIMLNVYWDTLVAGHALNENESHSLKDLYIKYVYQQGEAHYFGELFDGIPACYVPYDIFMSYAAKDAKMTYDLYMFQKPYLTAGTEECEEYKLERVANLYYTDLLPMIPILVDMKITGMEFDFKVAKQLKEKYTKLKEEAEKEFYSALRLYKDDIVEYNSTHKDKPLEYPLNYNSSEQMRVLFYDIAKIGVVYRKEPTGTGKNVTNAILHLEKFNNTPIKKVVECLSKVKMYDKVISSFIDKLTENAILHHGKIHSNLNLCGTVTGRLSCIAEGTAITVAGGTVPIERVHEGMYVYCYDDNGDIHLRKVKRVIYNGVQKCIKVIWKAQGTNNYGELICTPNHLLRCSDGTWKRADSFKKFERITHLRRSIKAGRHYFYGLNLACEEQIVIKKDYFNNINDNYVIHHVDRDKLNNSLDNFMIMTKQQHTSFHSKLLFLEGKLDVESFHKVKAVPKFGKDNPNYKYFSKEQLLKMLKDADYKLTQVPMDFDTFKKKCKEVGFDALDVCKQHYTLSDDDFISVFYECEGVIYRICNKLHIGASKAKKYIDKLGLCYNHKFISYEDYGYMPVYDLEVEEYHNFIANELCVHNCSEPNQQQVPSKLKDIRQMFYAGDNKVIIGCDFSKQEPCVLASTCKDQKLIDVFHSGLDVYSKIASMMYNVPYEDCLEEYEDGTTNIEGEKRRSAAKKVVLSIMYSKGEKTLAEDISSTPEKAKQIMDATLSAYPDMKKWMNKVTSEAKQRGYAEHLFGRRRRWEEFSLEPIEIHFPEGTEEPTKKYYTNIYKNKLSQVYKNEDKYKIVESAKQKGIKIILNEEKIAKATREIVNFYIQGASAVITLRAMRNIYNNPILQKYGCKLIMSVHDENLVVAPKEHAYECAKIIEQCSIDAGKGLPVPLSCDVAIAEHWYGTKLFFDENHNLIEKEHKK